MADGGAGRDGARGDGGEERAATHFDDGSAQHFCGVDEVATDIGEHSAARAAPVAPRHRHLRVERVAVPGVAVEVHGPSEVAFVEFTADRVDRGRPPVGVAQCADPVVAGDSLHHRLRIGNCWRQGLFAQHVLACGQQRLDDLAVQTIGQYHAHRVDVVGLDDRLPVVGGALETVAPTGVLGEFVVDVGDGDQAHVGS